jgi:hypothetical protein
MPLYLLYLSNPSAVDCIPVDQWNCWKCGLHYYKRDSNCPAGATTGTVSVPTTADTIDENDETLALLWNCFGYWNKLSTITMPYCGNDHSCFGYRRI